MFAKVAASVRGLVLCTLCAATALILSAKSALATATPIQIPDVGVDVAGSATTFGTALGLVIAVAVGLMFAIAIIVIGVRWIMKGGRGR